MDIPQSIAKLCNLETLIMRKDSRGRIAGTLWRMKSLKHVRIDKGCVSLEDFEGNECYIETLCGVIMGDDPRTVELLRGMTRLRKLKCFLKVECLKRAWFSIFGTLEKLEELKIEFWYGPTRYFSQTCSFLQNLRKLSLAQLTLASWSEMSTIGKQLSILEVLKLWDFVCEGSGTWDLEDGEFPKLRYLKLRRFSDLEEINVHGCENPFPSLEVLLVVGCEKLKGIPSEIGHIVSLNTIKLLWCSAEASESVMRILQEQREDYGNHTLRVLVN